MIHQKPENMSVWTAKRAIFVILHFNTYDVWEKVRVVWSAWKNGIILQTEFLWGKIERRELKFSMIFQKLMILQRVFNLTCSSKCQKFLKPINILGQITTVSQARKTFSYDLQNETFAKKATLNHKKSNCNKWPKSATEDHLVPRMRKLGRNNGSKLWIIVAVFFDLEGESREKLKSLNFVWNWAKCII